MLGAIERLLMRWPFYGYRRVAAQLKREGWTVGEMRVRRLLRQIDHSCSVGRVRVVTTDSDHDPPRHPNRVKGLDITRPNQVWVAERPHLGLSSRAALVIYPYWSASSVHPTEKTIHVGGNGRHGCPHPIGAEYTSLVHKYL
jgi:hypothetical protein